MQRLAPLKGPLISRKFTAVEALAFPAVQLFVGRTLARLDESELSHAYTSMVARMFIP